MAGSVSVDHASSWVALKGPWRRACARVGGREGDGLSGCDPEASIEELGVQGLEIRCAGRQPLTPVKLWGAGKDFQRPPDGDGAGTGTRSRGRGSGGSTGQLGCTRRPARRVARWLISVLAAIGLFLEDVEVQYVKSPSGAVAWTVSVDHASSWVALKGPWRHACARVGGREGDGLSGCDPEASIEELGVQGLVGRW
jgi:hypothetical protein